MKKVKLILGVLLFIIIILFIVVSCNDIELVKFEVSK